MLLERVPVPAYACDAQGQITSCNERAAALWGRWPKLNDPHERYCGSYALLSADGDPLPPEQTATALAIRDGRPHEGEEAIVVCPNGTRRTVLYYASPIVDNESVVAGATCVMIDITEREAHRSAAQAALEQSEANFRSFFDTIAVGAGQVNTEGRFVRVNDRYCEITGYTREELLAMGPLDLVHPEDRGEDIARLLKAVSDPSGIYHAEKRYVRKDGTSRWVHVAANMVRDASGKPMHTSAIVMDITERKRAEEALQEADRRKDDFLATLAHELRNPLSPMKNAVELLRDPEQRDVQWCRGVLERQVDHLSRLIDDLLDVSRIARDKIELRKERIALADVINGAVEASRPRLEVAEQKLALALPAEPVHVDGDLVRLTQVFTNLLTNAAKFSERPGTVRITASRQGGTVEAVVEDEGRGIPSDALERVFDKFYQSEGRGKQGGLGIGLSLVRRLVELHGGTVEARSAGAGRGSAFVVRLPIAAPPTLVNGPSLAAAWRRSTAKRIMVVDDNVDGAQSLSRLLGVMGFDTVTEYDGDSALQRARSMPFDVIFLDLGMPGLDGYDICGRLRDLAPEGGPWPKIVALTGWGRKEDVSRSRQAGFDAHIVKPVDRPTLARLLDAFCR